MNSLSDLSLRLIDSKFVFFELSFKMLASSFFFHIISIQFFILLEHPFIGLVKFLIVFFNYISFGLGGHYRDFIDDMMRNESSVYALH